MGQTKKESQRERTGHEYKAKEKERMINKKMAKIKNEKGVK